MQGLFCMQACFQRGLSDLGTALPLGLHIADLKDYIYRLDPHIIIPHRAKLIDYRNIAHGLIHPTKPHPSFPCLSKRKGRLPSPKPQELKDKFISEFDPDDPALRISDLKDFISKVDPNIQLPNRVRLEELRDTARAMINTRGSSRSERYCSTNQTALSKPRNLKEALLAEFDVKDPNVRIADLKEFINQVEPKVDLLNAVSPDLQMVSTLAAKKSNSFVLTLTNGILHVTSLQDKTRSASPRPQELKDKFISEFDPDDPALRISDLKDFISKVDPNIQLPNRVRLEELRDTARAIINTRGSSRSERYCSTNQTALSKPRNLKEALLAEFDVKDPNVQIADLKEFINQVEPKVDLLNAVSPDLQMVSTLAAKKSNSFVLTLTNGILHVTSLQDKTRSASPRPQELKDKFISEFDPDDPALRISDLKDFISKVDPNIQLPNRVRLEELRDTARAIINTRGCYSQRRPASPARSGLRSRSASPPLRSIKDFNPYSSGVQKADLREVMLQIDPSCHIPSNIRLAELRDMTYSMIHPYASLPHSQRGSFGTNRNRSASPARSGLRSRSASPPSRSIKEFDPYSSGVHKADLREVMLQIDPSCHIPSNIRLAELRDMTYRSASPARSGLRSRSASPPSRSIKEFDPYSSGVHKADLREVMLQINPSCHIPSNIRLAELRDMTYSMIHPYASLPHSQRGSFETNCNRSASPARSGLRSRSASPPSRSIKDFNPYSSGIHKADLREVMLQINPSCHIPSNIRLAELRDMTYSMIHPYSSLPHSQRGSFETSRNRAASPARPGLRSRPVTPPSQSIKDFDPYSPNVHMADLREVVFQINPNCHIPCDIRLAELRNMVYSMIHPHPRLHKKVSSTSHSAINFSKNQSTSSGPRRTPSPRRVQFSRHHLPPSGQQSPSSRVLAITKNSNHEFGGHSLEINSDSEIDELDESNDDTEDDGESDESDLHESKSDETEHLKISTNVNRRGPIKVQPQSKILQKRKASSQNEEQNFKEAINSDSSSDTPTYYCKRKRYLNGVFIPHDVEFMTEVDGLEYGSTPSDESSSESFTHEKPKCNQKGSSKSKQPDSLKSACKSPAYLIDLVGASQNSSGPSISDPSGSPSKTLSGLTGSCPAPSSTGKFPSLPLDFVMSQRPPAPPRPLKPPALRQTPLEQPSKASTSRCFQVVVDGNAPGALEYGSTPTDESLSKSFPHDNPKSNQKDSSNTKQPDGLKSASKSPTDLIDLTGAKWDSSGPSISDPSGNPSKTLSGLTGSCPAPSSTGKVPSLPLDFVMSQRPPALPRPLKPPALRRTPLRQPSKALTSRCFQAVVDGNAPGALEYGSTPSDESSSKSFTHEKPKCNQKGLSKSKQPDSLKSACKSPAYLIDLVGASQNSSGPSISDPSGNPSKTLSGLTGSCPALSSTGKVPSLPLDFVMSQRPPAPPRPLKPPALCQTPLRQPSEASDSNNDSSNVSVWPSFETQQPKVDYEFTDPPHMIGEAVSSSMKASVPLKEIRALHSSHIIPSIISSPNPWVTSEKSEVKTLTPSSDSYSEQIKVRVNPAEFEENTSGQKTQTISLINNPWVDVAVSNSKQNLGKALQLTKSEFHEANQSASEPSNEKTSPAQKNRRHSSHNYMAFTTSSGTSMNNPVSPRVSPAKPILMRPQPIEQNKFQESSPKQQAESTSCQLEQTPLYSRSAEEVDNPSKSSTSKDILNTNSSLNFNASQPIARKTSIASHPLAVIESLERCKLELKKHPKTIGGGGKN
ncbi:hypothetical protein PPACK8108_LOCUS21004 [Phakopsora pachyrhizi]|uniref:Uncharacterized protein n=1 Tax=Phakopsora pachyrhizi TaxID=170000 RepID=A0AAV0BJS1_PHAPC|nr:hypothetical protein PPACK8108_LOCUS21004 [Phakopsora pachyrhizi]